MEFHNFSHIKEATKYFKENNFYVCGVEITADSENVVNHPFKGNTVK